MFSKKYSKCLGRFNQFFGAFAITFLLTMTLVIPVLTKQEPVVAPASDTPEPYIYWTAPENSMGISSTKTVNWSYFKELFLEHNQWALEYKRFIFSEWTDGSDYLTIERTWNESGFWKFNLVLDVPVDVFSARFTYACDLPVLDYVNRESKYAYYINYTVPGTNETYNCFFNWSDMASIPNVIFTHGVREEDDLFWFRFRRDNIPAGHYEFDPTFGNTGTSGGSVSLEDYVGASYFQMGAETSQAADSISAFVFIDTTTHNQKCGLFDTDGVFIAATEEKAVTDGEDKTWVTFNFASPPSLTADAYYYIGIFTQPASDYAGLRYENTGGTDNLWNDAATYPTWPNPFADAASGEDKTYLIYCTYSEGGGPSASWNNISYWNGTIYNTTTWENTSYWNGSLYNTTEWLNVSYWNGTLYNSTDWFNTSYWNGSIYNTTNWQNISYWNGSIYNESDDWNNISYWNGTLYNSTDWQNTSYWNGSLYNASNYYNITYWNGSIYNSTGWINVSYWNGSIYNSTSWQNISFWNGTIYNSTDAWNNISYWNGTIYNSTSWDNISYWNGSIYNSTDEWLNTSYWNGSIYNSTNWNNITYWNGTIYNTSKVWTNTTYWNGTIYNTSKSNIPLIDYMFPLNESINVCPCDSCYTFTISQPNGTAMNVTVYGSQYPSHGFYPISDGAFYNVTNGSYSFCMNDFDIPHIIGHAHTQQNVTATGVWYNVTFDHIHNKGFTAGVGAIIPYNGMYTMRYWAAVQDSSPSVAGHQMAIAIFCNGEEIDGSYREMTFSAKSVDQHITGQVHDFFYAGDNITFRYIGDDTDQSLYSNGTWSSDDISVYGDIMKDDSIVMEYNQTYYWYINVSVVDSDSVYNQSDTFWFTTDSNTSNCTGGGGDDNTYSTSVGIIGVIGIIGLVGWLLDRKRRKRRRR